MRATLIAVATLLTTAVPIWADVESILLQKFEQRKRLEIEKLRASVTDAVAQAKEMKETEPERGMQRLRDAAARVDAMRLLSHAERKALLEMISPPLAELRDASVLKKRELATERLDLFREYLERVAPSLRHPGRSGDDHWEPAHFTLPNGQAQLGKLYLLGTGSVNYRFGREERTSTPLLFPWIQVAGGLYVYDFSVNHHMFLTNREFYESTLLPLVRMFLDVDGRAQGFNAQTEVARSRSDARLRDLIDKGSFFVRGLPDEEPIPGVGDREGDFINFAAQRVLYRGLPLQIDRIYPRDLEEALAGYTGLQRSAIHRSLRLLRIKGVTASKFYAEILREEISSLIRSEYPNFSEPELNRALVYLFDKLR